MSLTPKRQRFRDEYLIDLNATQAAIRAGYSARTAEQAGYRLLMDVQVSASIAAAQKERSERTKIDADWVLRVLAEEKSADLAAIYADDGSLLPVKDWPMVFRTGLVVGIETVESMEGSGDDRKPIAIRKVKLADRIKHLELIGKHVDVQAFREQRAITGPKGEPMALLNVDLSHLTIEQLRVLATLKLGDAPG